MPSNKNKQKAKALKPLVSVCTPTFNRRPFIKTMLQCFRNQDYPKSRMEWIIVDDGTDKIKDLIDEANIPQIQYFPINRKMALGEKRNFMHTKTKGSILVYMDDDDYYPPERVSHAVERLQGKKEALCAGSSEIYVYFKHIQKMYQGGPYGPNHATEGTFAFRRELLDQSKYEDRAALAEEKEFLKNYTIPFVQLDPLKTILVFSHIQNTFDKKKLLENPSPLFIESSKTVDMFIRKPLEQSIKDYFMRDIDQSLENYLPGNPVMKPDVLVQMKEIDEKRQKMMEQARNRQQGAPQVMVRNPNGGPDRALNQQEIVQLLQQIQEQCKQKDERINSMEETLRKVREELVILKVEKAKQERDASKKTVSFEQVKVETKNVDVQTLPIEEEKENIKVEILETPEKPEESSKIADTFVKKSRLTPEVNIEA